MNYIHRTPQPTQDEIPPRLRPRANSSLRYIFGITAGFATYEVVHEIFFPALGAWEPVAATVVVAVLATLFILWFRRLVQGQMQREKQLTEELRRSEEFVRQLLRSFPNGSVSVFDRDLRYLLAEGQELKQVGLPSDKLIGKTLDELFSKESVDLVKPYYQRAFSGEIVEFELPLGERVYEIHAAPLRHQDREVYAVVAVAQNIVERKQAEEQLRHRAFHDPLTDLPNRHLFLDRLRQALKRAERRGGRVAVLFMDLNNFKVVNDSLGHETGDELLVAVAQRLLNSLRPEDTLSRFGGDEFTVLLESLKSPSEATTAADRIAETFGKPFKVDGREVFVAASIGIALGTPERESPEELLRNADAAMYRAKEQGDINHRVFTPEMHERARKRLRLENDLRRATERKEFRIHYQPIFDLETGKPTKVEALVRWEHPELGLVPPGEFIPLAEETGVIISLGRWVLEEACRQTQEWQDRLRFDPPLALSINLSAKQLRHPDLVRTIEHALQESRFEARCLVLDLTETVLIRSTEEDGGGNALLTMVKGMGIKISIDDFGTGYSSLSYLRRLPADVVKIDRSFVSRLGKDVGDTTVVRMIVELAHALGLEVVGEGIETAEQATWLREMGCDMGQGFHFARPLPTEDVLEYLARNLS